MCFSSGCFQVFFQKFDYDLGVDFFQFILLGFTALLESVYIYCQFRSLSAIILFSTTFFLLSWQDSHDMNIRLSVLVPQVAKILFHFYLHSVLSLLFRWGNFYWPIFNLTDSFFCPLHSATEAIQWVFHFGYLIGSSLYNLFLCREFHFSIYFTRVWAWLLEYLCDSCFKIFVR